MEVAVYNIKGEDTGRKITFNDDVFARDLSVGNADHTLYLDVKQFLGNQRQGTHKSKERSEVSGSTRKLGRQKVAAAHVAVTSTLRSSWRRHSFRSRPRDYRTKLNKKMKRLARKIALTSKANEGVIIVVENFNFDKPSTKGWMSIAKSFKVDEKKTLLVMNDLDKNVLLSVRNVPNALMQQAADLNAYTVLNNDAIIMTEGSVELINENF